MGGTPEGAFNAGAIAFSDTRDVVDWDQSVEEPPTNAG
jgi:hypothetical protein